MKLDLLQKDILEYALSQGSKATYENYVYLKIDSIKAAYREMWKTQALNALYSLRIRGLVQITHPILQNPIIVTDKGRKILE